MSTMDRDEFDRLLREVEQMDDEALDTVVARVGGDYNAPPAGFTRPPVEAMWAHIAAAQQPAKRSFTVQRWQLLAASVAFLAFGITIGRQWSDVTRTGAPASHVTRAVSHSTSTPSAAATTSDSPADAESGTSGSGATSATDATHSRTSSVHTRLHDRSHDRSQDRSQDRSYEAPHVGSGIPSASAPTVASGNDAAYRLATLRHFAAAEALLASYDGSTHDAKTDAQLASWASDLLSQTRLLLDSPAGRDPVRRHLLQDLELVLVQMAQLGPNAPKLEHDLIDGSVRHNDIITRLHTAVPVGATTAL